MLSQVAYIVVVVTVVVVVAVIFIIDIYTNNNNYYYITLYYKNLPAYFPPLAAILPSSVNTTMNSKFCLFPQL